MIDGEFEFFMTENHVTNKPSPHQQKQTFAQQLRSATASVIPFPAVYMRVKLATGRTVAVFIVFRIKCCVSRPEAVRA